MLLQKKSPGHISALESYLTIKLNIPAEETAESSRFPYNKTKQKDALIHKSNPATIKVLISNLLYAIFTILFQIYLAGPSVV